MSVLFTLLRRYGASGVMVALAVGSFWTLSRLDLDLLAPNAERQHTPDFYMENFVTTKMDEFGAVHRRVEADYMAHFPDTDTREFQQPYMVMYRQAAQPWHVRSERGWLSASGDVMLLLGKVHIWRDDANGVKELDVNTEDLRVLPEREYGETDKPVVITTATTQTHGVGMKAYLAESRLELLSKVHTRHEPTRK
ncbi:MAG: lipopolysaccharide export system protein LptC [Gammaproteobacteria bacterium]|jgi:lipopolysaccharide export system protein LptC